MATVDVSWNKCSYEQEVGNLILYAWNYVHIWMALQFPLYTTWNGERGLRERRKVMNDYISNESLVEVLDGDDIESPAVSFTASSEEDQVRTIWSCQDLRRIIALLLVRRAHPLQDLSILPRDQQNTTRQPTLASCFQREYMAD
jgi:hypothetical protein